MKRILFSSSLLITVFMGPIFIYIFKSFQSFAFSLKFRVYLYVLGLLFRLRG